MTLKLVRKIRDTVRRTLVRKICDTVGRTYDYMYVPNMEFL